MQQKDRKRLFAELEASGWRIERSKSGWKCYSPCGRYIVTMHATPSEYRGARNIMSEFRKAGFQSGQRKKSA